MNTRNAHLVAAFFLVALTAQLIVSVRSGSALLPGLVVLVLVALAATGLLAIPADPLPTGTWRPSPSAGPSPSTPR